MLLTSWTRLGWAPSSMTRCLTWPAAARKPPRLQLTVKASQPRIPGAHLTDCSASPGTKALRDGCCREEEIETSDVMSQKNTRPADLLCATGMCGHSQISTIQPFWPDAVLLIKHTACQCWRNAHVCTCMACSASRCDVPAVEWQSAA